MLGRTKLGTGQVRHTAHCSLVISISTYLLLLYSIKCLFMNSYGIFLNIIELFELLKPFIHNIPPKHVLSNLLKKGNIIL